MQKSSFSHCGHIQGKTHVGLFQLYLASLSLHSSSQVENLEEISCCFQSRISRYLNRIRLGSLLYGLQGLFRPFQGTFITKFNSKKLPNWQHRDVQFRRWCGQRPRLTMEVSRHGQRWIGYAGLNGPELCIILLVVHHLHRYGVTHVRSHAASDCCCVWFYILYVNVHPGSYFRWLQLQRRGELTGVCVAAVSQRVAHCLMRLSIGSIRLQLHLVEVFLPPWLSVVEWWGRWSRKEVGCPEQYIVRYKSKWNEWQPTCTFNTSWIQLRIAALRIAAGDSNGPAICSESVPCCLFVCRDILWRTTADISFW